MTLSNLQQPTTTIKKRVYEDLDLPSLKKSKRKDHSKPLFAEFLQNVFLFLHFQDPTTLAVQLVCKNWCTLYRNTDIHRQFFQIGLKGKGALSAFVETYYSTALERTYYCHVEKSVITREVFDYALCFRLWEKHHVKDSIKNILRSSLVFNMTDEDFVSETLVKGILAYTTSSVSLDLLKDCQNTRIASIYNRMQTAKQRFKEWKTNPTTTSTAKLTNVMNHLLHVCPHAEFKLHSKISIKGNWQRVLCEAWECQVVKDVSIKEIKMTFTVTKEPLRILSLPEQTRFLRIYLLICQSINEPIPHKLVKLIATFNPKLIQIRELVLEIVSSNGLAIEFAPEWHTDPEIVNCAIRQNKQAKNYILKKL